MKHCMSGPFSLSRHFVHSIPPQPKTKKKKKIDIGANRVSTCHL